ncbi:serine/threonine protein phosphatase [Aromatoleum toluvorans]|uniref:Serine/threonine protein phosphatase n=1 Tax=Aromatoleum toluvorans TaxID=92002 RepID=A0ABX1PW34_9RHOO|nr:metallophosphoesterase family protein [Aromatoleum toluvorans]NMG42429.1 serine/threonine protein phosphatase [Aromatoleum toluvorans]
MKLRWAACRPPEGERAPSACTPPGTVVYAIGDIHGRLDLLDALLQGIALDARLRPAQRRVLVYLGDYVSRGPDSRGVVDRVIDWRPEGFEVIALKGNHEEVMLRFLDGELFVGGHWMDYGGADTLAHYGVAVDDPSCRDPETLAHLCARLRGSIPPAHLALLRGLAPSHREGGYLFVHAGVLPGVPLGEQSERDFVWIRKRFLVSDRDHGAVVVHGHCISEQPDVRHNRIGIDTGAYRSGVLTCLVLDGTERSFLQTTTDFRNGPAEARGEVCPDSCQ